MSDQVDITESQSLLRHEAVVSDYRSTDSPIDARERDDVVEGIAHVRTRLKFIFPALAIGIFLAAGDQTVIVSSYGRIGSDLHELDKTAWLATAYLCTTTAFQPLYGKLGDIFGRKPCLLFAYSIFGLGALCCGAARNMNELIVARALTGVGAGGIITAVSILLSDVVSREERAVWQGYVNMVFAIGGGLGAPLGGILTDAVGWRWAFLGQTPLCAIAVALIAILLHLPKPKDDAESTRSKLAKVDVLGAFFLIAFIVLLLMFLDALSSGTMLWTSYFCLLGSTLSFIMFLWVEAKVAAEPLTPLQVLFGRDFLGAYLALGFGNVAWYGVLFYVPLLYQVVGHFSASASGAFLLPGILSGIIGGFVGGALIKRGGGTGFRRLALGSYPLVTLSCFGIAMGVRMFWSHIPTASIVAMLSGSLLVGGLGNGGGMGATLVVVIVVAAPSDQAVATACVYLYRQLGATVGLAVISLVFQRVLQASLDERLKEIPDLGLNTPEIARRVRESLSYLDQLPGEARIIVEHAYGDACQSALAVCVALGFCAIICAYFIRETRKPVVT